MGFADLKCYHFYLFYIFPIIQVCALKSNHQNPVGCVQFSPRHMMMASACQIMSFWLPNLDKIEEGDGD